MKLACVNWAGAEVKVRVLGSSDLLEIGKDCTLLLGA